MKYNKQKFGLRLITFPIKLAFQLVFRLICALMETYQWVRFGGQEVIYSDDNGKSLCVIIEQNKELIELLKKEKDV